MVNYHDPAVIAQEFMGVVKLWHVVDGIFIWEFLTTLNFEWDIIRGHRPYRWAIWVYFLARAATILAVVLNMIVLDTTTPINCQLWVFFGVLFAHLTYAASSLLIVLRVIAIWNMSKTISAISMTVWTADVSILLYCLVQVRSKWSPEAKTCAILQFNRTKPSIVSTLVTDLVLLLIMLFGLLRLRLETGCAFGTARVLWKQGLIWLFVATVAEVPSTVLLLLDLNVSLNLMTQTPSMIIISIAATRSYRNLINVCSPDVSNDIPGAIGPAVSDIPVRSGALPLNRVEVTVPTQYDQYPTSEMTRHASTDTQGRYKAPLKGDEESCLEK